MPSALLAISCCFLIPSISWAEDRQGMNIEGPFARSVYLPASADVSSIRLEKVRKVKVDATIKYGFDPAQCQELVTGELWRSTGCVYKTIQTTVAAFEVIYSYTGEPLASDEYANRTFTFGVYFRPEDLSEELQNALSGRRLSRSQAAQYFVVSIQRNSPTGAPLDPLPSHPCETRGCKDSATYAGVSTTADEITAVIEPRPFGQPSVANAPPRRSKR